MDCSYNLNATNSRLSSVSLCVSVRMRMYAYIGLSQNI